MKTLLETVNVHEAKTRLLRLVERARTGEAIVLVRANVPYARLSPPAAARRPLGLLGRPLSPEAVDESLRPLDPEEADRWT